MSDLDLQNVETWDLRQWNAALLTHFFSAASSSESITTLYVTAEELREATRSAQPSADIRRLFINIIQRVIGTRTLGRDAVRQSMGWEPESSSPPQFLAHLLFACMVANDVSESLEHTGNFRTRLSQLLGSGVHHGLDRLRPLWEQLAEWLVAQNVDELRFRPLELPQVPSRLSIIGYNLLLAGPSIRDQQLLTGALESNGISGAQPTLTKTISVCQAISGRFSLRFAEMFGEFIQDYGIAPVAVLHNKPFWRAVRDVAGRIEFSRHSKDNPSRYRIELDDDEGRFWLLATADRLLSAGSLSCTQLPVTRTSAFRFGVSWGNPQQGTLTDLAFGESLGPTEVESVIRSLRSALSEGIALFSEDIDEAFELSTRVPYSGRLRALIKVELTADFSALLKRHGETAHFSPSIHPGWNECRNLTAAGMNRVDWSLSPFGHLQLFQETLSPPIIFVRSGFRVGDTHLALPGLLPTIEIENADSVVLVSPAGRLPLVRSDGSNEWAFPLATSPQQLAGRCRLIAFAEQVQISERRIAFTEAQAYSGYKPPADRSRWIVEGGRDDVLIPVEGMRDDAHPKVTYDIRPSTAAKSESSRDEVETLNSVLCAYLTSHSGISEGAL